MNPLCPPPLPHDTEAALVRAEAHCTTRGTRLTPLRRAILALILAVAAWSLLLATSPAPQRWTISDLPPGERALWLAFTPQAAIT